MILRDGIPLFCPLFAIYNLFAKGGGIMYLLRRIVLSVFAIGGSVIFTVLLITKNISAADEQVISLPYRISGTNIILESIAEFDGPYFEDRSNDEVADVASITLYNNGPELIKSLVINLATEYNTYCFEATMIPPEAKVLVLDASRNAWDRGKVVLCRGKEKTMAFDNYKLQAINCIQPEMNNISALCDEPISIYCKKWSDELQTYIGGITDKIEICCMSEYTLKKIRYELDLTQDNRIVFIE